MKFGVRGIFLGTILFYIVLSVVPSKPLALVAIAVYMSGLALVFQNIPEALSLAYIALLPINVGKRFFISLVPSAELNISGRLWGIDADIVVTVREILVAIMALVLLWRFLKQKRVVWLSDRLSIILFFLPFIFLFSTFLGSFLPWVSFFHALFFFEPFILYVYARTHNVTNYKAFVAVLVASISFEGILALMQNIKGRTLGLLIEDYPGYIPLDTSRDTSSVVFRFGGTFFDANTLANYLIFAILVLLPTMFDVASPLRLLSGLAVIVGILALIVTQSRSAWLAWAVALLLFFYLIEKVWRRRLILPKVVGWIMLLSVPMLLILGVTVVIPRIAGTAYTFEPFGSGETRRLLLQQALSAIGAHPLFGVGIAMDVYYMFLNMAGPRWESIVSYFPEPVHNAFIQIFVQTGIVGFLAYVACWIALLFALWRRMEKASRQIQLYVSGLFAGAIAVIVNAQLQPMVPNLAAIVLLYASLLHSDQKSMKGQKPDEKKILLR